MAKFQVEWYIDIVGMNSIHILEVEAESEDEARKQAIESLWSCTVLGEVNEIK